MRALKGSLIGIELLDGTRIIGVVQKWTKEKIYVLPDSGVEIDIPRDICRRIFVLVGDVNEEN